VRVINFRIIIIIIIIIIINMQSDNADRFEDESKTEVKTYVLNSL